MTLATLDPKSAPASISLAQILTATWIGLAAAFIVWPFSWSVFSSQLAGACMLLPCLARVKYWPASLKTFLGFAWLPYVLLLGILLLHRLHGGDHPGLLLFTAYLIKIPLLSLLVIGAFHTLQRTGLKSGAILLVFWLAALLPVLVILFQWLIPSFQLWSIRELGGFRVEHVINGNNHGHPFRFFGLNGFLFASHGIAFVLTALGMLVTRAALWSRPNTCTIFFYLVEFTCLFLALLSGRSALPLIGLYVIVSLYLAQNLRQRLTLFGIYVLLTLLLASLPKFSQDGKQLVEWLIEPLQTSLSRRKLASASFDITIESYQGLPTISSDLAAQKEQAQATESTLEAEPSVLFGQGIYFRNNDNYNAQRLTASDSGFVRLLHVSGYVGCTLFILFWLALLIRVWKNSRNQATSLRLYLALFVAYGMVFFVKSEWLYQNFFIFYFFVLFHHFDSADQNHAHHIRPSISASA